MVVVLEVDLYCLIQNHAVEGLMLLQLEEAVVEVDALFDHWLLQWISAVRCTS